MSINPTETDVPTDPTNAGNPAPDNVQAPAQDSNPDAVQAPAQDDPNQTWIVYQDVDGNPVRVKTQDYVPWEH